MERAASLMPVAMTPLEAFVTLRERRIQEIAKGREPKELSTPELAECMRRSGCRIPRFVGEGYAVTSEIYDWAGTIEGEREIARFMAMDFPAPERAAS
jgi:hypothetical protein